MAWPVNKMLSEKIGAELKEAANVLQEFLSNKNNIKQIEDAARAISNAFKNGKKLITCGNGGSMCDAMHFAEELSGRFREHRASFPAMAISDPSFLSCSGNDYGYEKVFSRFISGIGQQGDVLAAISTSGNSANIIEAVKMAREKGMTVVGFTGKTGGELSALCDIEIRSPHTPYADRAQEIHIKAIHIIILLVEELMENKG